jgi:hypothetical protein
MEGDPTQFEAIGNRLGFDVAAETDDQLHLVWRGPRFPAFLCLGIALLLLFVSVPIVYAIYLNGFVGAAGSLWYFPFMNLILFGIALYLLYQKRTIVVSETTQRISLTKRSFYRITSLSIPYVEIEKFKLGADQVYSGFAVAGSSAAESFAVPSLRLVGVSGQSVLLDRGSFRRLESLGKRLADRTHRNFEIDTALRR